MLVAQASVVVCPGGFAWDAALRLLDGVPSPRPRFAHAAETVANFVPVYTRSRTSGDKVRELTLLGSDHVSQQNTFTGRLTEPMLDAVLARALELAAGR